MLKYGCTERCISAFCLLGNVDILLVYSVNEPQESLNRQCLIPAAHTYMLNVVGNEHSHRDV